ncbi:MAG: RNA polymerase sigma factor [Actinomycetota bacterium]
MSAHERASTGDGAPSGGRIRAGDARSFAAMLPEHDDYLRGLAWAVVRDPNAIDDIMQTTYEQAYRARDSFDGRSSLRSWLHTICYRTAIDHIRYESRRRTVGLDHDAAERLPASQPSITAEIVIDAEAVDVLSRVDPEQRALLYFTAGLGYSYDEVAEIVGMQRGTVASKVSRAKERLRKGPRP